MTFVPTPHTPPSVHVSPRARDLARSLEKAVEEYRAKNPQLSDAEVRQALALLSQTRSAAGPGLLLGLVAAGLAVLGVVAFNVFQGGEAGGESLQWVVIVVGGLAAVLGIRVAVGRRGSGGP